MRFLIVVSEKDFSGASFDGILISNKTLVISTIFLLFYAKIKTFQTTNYKTHSRLNRQN
jgi:hypothetical protein